jgi:hypothetical protein
VPRIAGDNPGYTFALLDQSGEERSSEYRFELPSVTTILTEVLSIPAGAMAWWGFRIAVRGVVELATALGAEHLPLDEAELEHELRAAGFDPGRSLSDAADRGRAAHQVLEYLALGARDQAEIAAAEEEARDGTRYGRAVIAWWDERVTWDGWHAEHPVWSLRHGYAGTADLIAWTDDGVLEVVDLKTHKPASGFTLPGRGPAYFKDLLQIRAYRLAWEEMTGATTTGQRVVVARENGAWLEDTREVSAETWLGVLHLYGLMQAFGGGS